MINYIVILWGGFVCCQVTKLESHFPEFPYMNVPGNSWVQEKFAQALEGKIEVIAIVYSLKVNIGQVLSPLMHIMAGMLAGLDV